MKPVEQLLRVRIAIKIDEVERMPIPRQELPDPERSGVVCGSDDHDPTPVARDQLEAPKNEGAHQDLAQLRIGLHQREELLATEFNHLPWFADAQPGHRRPTRNQVGFSREAPGAMADDERLPSVGDLQRLNLARDHDEARHDPIADIDQHFPARGRSSSAVRDDSRELRGRQLWKQALGTRDRHCKRCLRRQRTHTAVVNGTSTTCSATNHTCSSLRRMTSLTSRSFVPSSPPSAARRAIVRASFSTISCACSKREIWTGASSRPFGGRGMSVVSATSCAIATLTPPRSCTRSATLSTSSFCSS